MIQDHVIQRGNSTDGGFAIGLMLVPCFALTVVLALFSDGAYHDDDLTHYLMARWSHWFPDYLLHMWGRPGLTVPLAAVAWVGDVEVGWLAARLLSASVTAVAALVGARLALLLGVRQAWLVVLACYLQPLSTVLSFTTLTENFASLYLVSAVMLLYTRRPVWASIVFSLILVTRHESIILLPLWYLGLAAWSGGRARKCAAASVALWAPMSYNVVFWWVLDEWPFCVFFQPTGSSEYPAIGVLGYVPHALDAFTPLIAGLALMGGVAMLRRGRLLIPALAGLFVLVHVAIKALGVFASGGYGRFMVTIAPLVAILAVVGWNDFRRKMRYRMGSGWIVLMLVWCVGLLAFEIERHTGRIVISEQRLLWFIWGIVGLVCLFTLAAWMTTGSERGIGVRLATLVVLGATCLVQWGMHVRPLRLAEGPLRVREVVTWLHERQLNEGPLFATHPWFPYFMGQIEMPEVHKGRLLLASMPVGTVLVWDSRYSCNDFHALATLAEFQADTHYEQLGSFSGSQPGALSVVLFRKIAETAIPATEEYYPMNLMSNGDATKSGYYVQ